MNKKLRYISISYKTASVGQREEYHIPEEEKTCLVELIRDTFNDIAGLFLLVTCNRTEIYFESKTTTANTLRDFLIDLKSTKSTETSRQHFNYGNTTEKTVKQLLNVSSGLASSVVGDAEIIYQIKKAYQFSIALKIQGSILERAMQMVFKSHKRISNETDFRDGTTSTAYKSLKAVNETYGTDAAKSRKILFIGAGDIIKQLFKYNSKFKFNNIHISNRTREKAMNLANKNKANVYDWSKVLKNDFNDFDVIISAASNCPYLVKNIPVSPNKILLIDLAVPSNIDKALANNEDVLFYDLDTISAELEDTKERRAAAIGKVDHIITEEFSIFHEWLEEAPLRAALAQSRIRVQQEVENYFEANEEEADHRTIKMMVDKIMRKSMKKTENPMTFGKIDGAVAEQVALLKK